MAEYGSLIPAAQEDSPSPSTSNRDCAGSRIMATVVGAGCAFMIATAVVGVAMEDAVARSPDTADSTLDEGRSPLMHDSSDESNDEKTLYREDLYAFKAQFGREYANLEEESNRLDAFIANSKRVESLNSEAGNPAVHALNKFADYTDTELQVLLGRMGSAPEAPRLRGSTFDFEGECTTCDSSAEIAAMVNDEAGLPTDFDWRDYGAVTGVKDQGYCGSCWSFSTTGDIEGSWYFATGELNELSEEQLVSCDKVVNKGCNGGIQEWAFNYLISKGGIVSEDSYPYLSGNGTSLSCESDIIADADWSASISDWLTVASGAEDEDLLQDALLKLGPLSMSLNAEPMLFYKSGVDIPVSCSPKHIDHAVLLVGWGEEDGTPYWTIKNSWGEDWGEDGYYRIIRGVNECGLASDVVHSVI